MLSNHCNVNGLSRRLQVNIQVFKIIKWNGDVFKNWLCPNFLSPPKKSELPKIWGGAAAPLAAPARTPMISPRSASCSGASFRQAAGDEPQGTVGRVQTAGEAPSRSLSPSRLPLRAHFHREGERDVWVRGRSQVIFISDQMTDT